MNVKARVKIWLISRYSHSSISGYIIVFFKLSLNCLKIIVSIVFASLILQYDKIVSIVGGFVNEEQLNGLLKAVNKFGKLVRKCRVGTLNNKFCQHARF